MPTISKFFTTCLSLTAIASFSPELQAHCEIPCGIYDDNARVKTLQEDAVTIAKSCKMIAELAGKTDAQSQNQLSRWVSNKEKHAQSIINTISNYYLTQRVKSSQKDYTDRLVKHHAIIVAAMKAYYPAAPAHKH